MAHFAKVVDGKIENVIVVKNEDCGGGDFPASEPVGQGFIDSLGLDGLWLQTSYNSNFRGQFATIGGFYDDSKNVFHRESPFPSWTLNSNGLFDPPKPRPEDGYWDWDESNLQWTQVE